MTKLLGRIISLTFMATFSLMTVALLVIALGEAAEQRWWPDAALALGIGAGFFLLSGWWFRKVRQWW